LLAALGASIAGFLLAREVLEIPYSFDAWVWIAGLGGGALLVAGAGWFATRSVVSSPPTATLRGG
jgi:putative ABC transport system permease protein